MGLPVLTGPGVGDVDAMLRDENVGVVLEDFSKESFAAGWRALSLLVADPTIEERCRSVARRRLSLGLAVELYESAYRSLVGLSAVGSPQRADTSPRS